MNSSLLAHRTSNRSCEVIYARVLRGDKLLFLMSAPGEVRARMYREYRLIWWCDRSSELATVSALVFVAWFLAALLWHPLFNVFLLCVAVWLFFCHILRRSAKKHYLHESSNQDAGTSRSMYKATFIDKLPERWYAATKTAGVYEGKTISECDIRHLQIYADQPALLARLHARFTEWRLSKKASQRAAE
jgi:hypothetical protein